MPRRFRVGPLLRAAAGVAAIVGLLWLLDRIGWGKVAEAFARVGATGAVAMLALGVLESLLDALALRVAVGGRIATHKALGYQSAGTLLNSVVPLEAGEVLKVSLLQREVPAADALSGIVIWNYVFKIARPVWGLATVAAGALLSRYVGWQLELLILAATLVSFIPYLVLRLVIRMGAAAALVRLARILRVFRRDPKAWRQRAERLDHTIRTFWDRRPRDFLRVLGLQILSRATSFTATFVAFRALGVAIDFPTALLLQAAMSAAEYLLLVIPVRVGVAEGAAFFVFGLFSLDPVLGVFTALALRLRTIAATALGSLLALLR